MKKLCNKCNTLIGCGPFEKHYRRCDGNGILKSNVFERVGDKSKCPICEKLFPICGIQSHYRIKHGDPTAFTKFCSKCNKFYKTCNFERHFKYCGDEKKKNKYFERVGNKSKCPICEKLFSPIGVQAHYRIIHKGISNHTITTWKRSNGAIKAKEKGREFIISKSTRNKLSKSVLTRSDEWNKNNGRKVSATILQKVNEGNWHTSLAKYMHINYKGNDLHGSWELKYAQYLDANNIKWVRNKDSFKYFFDGKERNYTPDFYLIDTDEYIEIKGYTTKKDEAKWKAFPHKLVVLKYKELKVLGIL